ncbi:hypothetical protein GWI33_010771 [Rhynchophorus ferrugineus]|uniref:Uncharacterized protein n=1 Tax=Rhynchophorus ferrugineus TaxID=354439 RepID=A0A834MJC9_RHYFE|nr:hypothetical protein GWI33_010771 [Rhynchophorus ferrugineus]
MTEQIFVKSGRKLILTPQMKYKKNTGRAQEEANLYAAKKAAGMSPYSDTPSFMSSRAPPQDSIGSSYDASNSGYEYKRNTGKAQEEANLYAAKKAAGMSPYSDTPSYMSSRAPLQDSIGSTYKRNMGKTMQKKPDLKSPGMSAREDTPTFQAPPLDSIGSSYDANSSGYDSFYD